MFALHLHDRPMDNYRDAYPVGDEPARCKALHLALLNAGFIMSPKLSAFLSPVTTTEDLDRFGEALASGLREMR